MQAESYDDSFLHLFSCPGHDCRDSPCWDDCWHTHHCDLLVPRSCTIQMEAHSEQKNRKFRSGSECSICLEPVWTKAFVMACSHSFHLRCFYEWLKTHWCQGSWGNCPLCRKVADCFSPFMLRECLLPPTFDSKAESVLDKCFTPNIYIALNIWVIPSLCLQWANQWTCICHQCFGLLSEMIQKHSCLTSKNQKILV